MTKYTVADIVQNALAENPAEASKALNDVMLDKIADHLEVKRQEAVDRFFNADSTGPEDEEENEDEDLDDDDFDEDDDDSEYDEDDDDEYEDEDSYDESEEEVEEEASITEGQRVQALKRAFKDTKSRDATGRRLDALLTGLMGGAATSATGSKTPLAVGAAIAAGTEVAAGVNRLVKTAKAYRDLRKISPNDANSSKVKYSPWGQKRVKLGAAVNHVVTGSPINYKDYKTVPGYVKKEFVEFAAKNGVTDLSEDVIEFVLTSTNEEFAKFEQYLKSND